MDTHSLGADQFQPAIAKALDNSKNVVVVISEDSFKNLRSDSNWVWEINEAIKRGINIVPFYFTDVEKAKKDKLPASLKNLPLTNSIIYNHRYAEASYDKLCSFLKGVWFPKINLKLVASLLVSTALLALGIHYSHAITKFWKSIFVKDSSIEGIVTQGRPVLVNLGLPSGTLWLDRNLGTGDFSESGMFFSWREIVNNKIEFSPENYTIRNFRDSVALHALYSEPFDSLKFDVAWNLSDGKWRTPTAEQFQELIDECIWEPATFNGLPGKKIIGKNGNAIFLPACGLMRKEGLKYENAHGYYWTFSQAVTDDTGERGLELLFSPEDDDQTVGPGWAYCGRQIRPVGAKR